MMSMSNNDENNLSVSKEPVVRPNLRRPGILDEILRTVVFIIVVTVLFDMGIPRSLVDGQSMEPTYSHNERLIVSRLHYLLDKPERGDVIVFNSVRTEREPTTMLIKRVIGLPGDTVEFRNQQVYINGDRINEPYTRDSCREYRCENQIIELQPDEFFVMGDNRNNSQDSRAFGPVPLNHIVGQVVFRYWPPQRIGFVGEHTYDLSE